MEIIKICTICEKKFKTKYRRQNICSFECKMEKNRRRARKNMRIKRHNSPKEKCQVCGYSEAADIHHENGKTYILCPNHHALITRGYKTLKELGL